jgi:nucleoside-diphosphate-sugar epimerase
MTTPKEGSSRVLTQFLGNIVRSEDIKLVDGGTQRRCFSYISEGISCLLKIIANKNGVASGKIYNIGNPANDFSIRELAEMMLATARSMPEYAQFAKPVKLVDVTAEKYYGAGYQDVRARRPWINNTVEELGWKPDVDMPTALRRVFDSYKANLKDARALVEAP